MLQIGQCHAVYVLLPPRLAAVLEQRAVPGGLLGHHADPVLHERALRVVECRPCHYDVVGLLCKTKINLYI